MQIDAEGLRVGVAGATGAVGREMLRVLEDRAFPVRELRLFASARSAGEDLQYRGVTVEVENLDKADASGLDVVLFSAGGSVSRQHAPRFAAEGALVIDNSSAWRMDDRVPLVVPEVNAAAARAARSAEGKGIIANPNCSTIQLVVALKPLHEAFGLRRVVVSTYQSVSGAGQKGIEELSGQVIALFSQREPAVQAFDHQIAFNCIPAIGAFRDDGYSEEEWKLVQESRKILGLENLAVVPTAIRVPTFACHGESVLAEFERDVTVEEARSVLTQAAGVDLRDDAAEGDYPMGVALAGSDEVAVGRVRVAPGDPRALAMWIVADNLRKGAATNAVQIAELFVDGAAGGKS